MEWFKRETCPWRPATARRIELINRITVALQVVAYRVKYLRACSRFDCHPPIWGPRFVGVICVYRSIVGHRQRQWGRCCHSNQKQPSKAENIRRLSAFEHPCLRRIGETWSENSASSSERVVNWNMLMWFWRDAAFPRGFNRWIWRLDSCLNVRLTNQTPVKTTRATTNTNLKSIEKLCAYP